jgi:phosphotriesterase-related protein
MAIETVLGPVSAEEFRFTSMHEHVFYDGRVWYMPGPDAALERREVCIENLGFIHWNIVGLEDNMIVDDPELAIRELSRLASTSANAIVDLTNIGANRRVADLPAISRATNVHIAMGCGFYVHESHPEWLDPMGEDDIAELIQRELTEGIDDTGILPALVGELGTSKKITPRERRVLRGCGRAAAATGVSVNVHLDPRGREALDAVETLCDVGVPVSDIILSHMQNASDWGYQRQVFETGAVVEYDTFGEEGYYGHVSWRTPTDAERIDLVEKAVADGFEDQVVLGADVWLKCRLREYGGMGYDHLFTAVLSVLRERGLSEETLKRIFRDTPRRLLDRSNRVLKGQSQRLPHAARQVDELS